MDEYKDLPRPKQSHYAMALVEHLEWPGLWQMLCSCERQSPFGSKEDAQRWLITHCWQDEERNY